MGAYSTLHDETYKQLTKHFPQFTIRENLHPDWLLSSNLTRLELDLYIEEINTAIEVQGLQHYEFTPHFHKTYADFEAQQRRDQEKRDLCYGRKVRLVEIAAWMDLHIFINELLESHDLPMLKKSAVEDAEVRKEIKAKRAARKTKRKAKKNLFYFPPLPGSQRQREYARHQLFANLMMDGRWVVWGGDSTHILAGSGETLRCNYRYAKEDNENLCSHIIKVQMVSGTFPERKKVLRS